MVRIQSGLDADTFQALRRMSQPDIAKKPQRVKGYSPKTGRQASFKETNLQDTGVIQRKQHEFVAGKRAEMSVVSCPPVKISNSSISLDRLSILMNADRSLILRAQEDVRKQRDYKSLDAVLFDDIALVEDFVTRQGSAVSIEEFSASYSTSPSIVRRICASEQIPISFTEKGFGKVSRADWLLLVQIFAPLRNGKREIWDSKQTIRQTIGNANVEKGTTAFSPQRGLRAGQLADLERDVRDLRIRFRKADRFEAMKLKELQRQLSTRISQIIEVALPGEVAKLRVLKRQVDSLDYRPPRKPSGAPVISGGLPSLRNRW